MNTRTTSFDKYMREATGWTDANLSHPSTLGIQQEDDSCGA